MKNVLCAILLFSLASIAYPQNFDLIVKSNGDSIACRIDSITNTKVYFEMKFHYSWTHTDINISDCIEYRMDAIKKESVVFKPGTSYIMPVAEQLNNIKKVSYFRRNTMYGTVGFVMLYLAIHGNYERLLWEPQRGPFRSVWVRVGGGLFSDAYGGDGTNIISGLTMLTGLRKAHLEFVFNLHSNITILQSDFNQTNSRPISFYEKH